MSRIQEPPFCVQVELTEGCTLACPFCGINGIRESKGGPFRFMTPGIATQIAKEMARLRWNSRIEFAMHGEPSINPARDEIIAIFRKHLPENNLMLTSNGSGFLKGGPEKYLANIRGIFDAGLNTLALDQYQNVDFVPKLREVFYAAMDKEGHVAGVEHLYEYPASPSGNPHQRLKRGAKMITLIAPIDLSTSGTHASLNNHAGAGAPKNDKAQGKRCAKPFRELSIRWDGSIAICCNDWRGEYKCGNVTMSPLEDIWQGPSFDAARKKLYHGMRDFGPCAGCDALSYRVGILPDPQGKETMEKPDSVDEIAIKAALASGPYTKKVVRSWEVKK